MLVYFIINGVSISVDIYLWALSTLECWVSDTVCFDGDSLLFKVVVVFVLFLGERTLVLGDNVFLSSLTFGSINTDLSFSFLIEYLNK